MQNFIKKIFFSFTLFMLVLYPLSSLSASALLLESDKNGSFDSTSLKKPSFINYENNEETLLLTFGSYKPDSDLVWIVPIPAKAGDIKTFNSVTKPPYIFNSGDINYIANSSIKFDMIMLSAGEFIPLLAMPTLLEILPSELEDAFYSNVYQILKDDLPDANIKPSGNFKINNNGVSTSVLDATNENDLKNYLVENDLIIDDKDLESLKDYYGKGFSFVISIISKDLLDQTPIRYSIENSEIIKEFEYRGIMIKFPTDRIFFPATKTSGDNSEQTENSVSIIGLYQPLINNGIRPGSEFKYFSNRKPIIFPSNFSNKLNSLGQNENFDYTTFAFYLENNSNEDIYFDSNPPLNFYLARFFFDNNLIWIIFTSIFFSMLSSTIAGLICFKEARSKKIIKFTFLGLFNLFTFWGLVLVTSLLKTKKVEGTENKYTRLDTRKILYLLSFLFINLFFINISGIITLWLLNF